MLCYDVIISLTDGDVTDVPFSRLVMSRRNIERFCVNLSLFLVNRFLSIPFIRLWNHCTSWGCLSLGCWEISSVRILANCSSLRSISPRSGRDMDHWLQHSSNITTFNTVANNCCMISGLRCSTSMNMLLVSGGGCRGIGTLLLDFCTSCLNK